MQVNTCMILEWATGHGVQGPGRSDAEGPAGQAPRAQRPDPRELCEPLRWRGSQRPSIWASWRPRTSSPPSGGAGRSCTTSTPSAVGHPGTRIAKFEHPPACAERLSSEPRRTHGRPADLRVRHLHRSSPERVGKHSPPDLTASTGATASLRLAAGSSWEHRRVYGSGIADVIGTVLESAPPRRRP